MDESKSEGGKVLDEPKWVPEGSEKGCLSLWKITGIYNGMSSTAAGLSLCRCPEPARRKKEGVEYVWGPI